MGEGSFTCGGRRRVHGRCGCVLAGRSSAGKNAVVLVLGPELRSRPCWKTDVSLKDEDQRVILGSAINLVGLIDQLTGDQFINELGLLLDGWLELWTQ